MAKQVGDIILVGTIDDITFYEMDGKGYARKKTSLTGKRVKKDPRFKRTMESANRFGKGNQLASKVYRSLPRPRQVYALFKELKRIAILGIKEDMSEAEVLVLLQQRVEITKDVTRTGAVSVSPDVRSQTGRIKKTPRLFRVYGGRTKAVRRQRVKQTGELQSGRPSRTGRSAYPQRE